MKYIDNSKLFAFDNVKDGLKIILSIEFQKTFIIVNSTLSEKLLIALERNINKLKIIPEFIIFTRDKNNKIFQNFSKYIFFDYNFVYDSFEPLLDKLKLRTIYEGRCFQKGFFSPNNDIFTFEHINSIYDLIFPIPFLILLFTAFLIKLELCEFLQVKHLLTDNVLLVLSTKYFFL
jgi:hypothetical protein